MTNKLKSGLFIALYDENTLNLYLKHGVYGFLMDPDNYLNTRSRHYNALADYACTREGAHVFFFLKRKIFYGGQIVGNIDKGSFILNGSNSALGKLNNSPLVWNEANRYTPEDELRGKFWVTKDDDKLLRSQPYLIKFKDFINNKGKYIISDELYYRLGRYHLPLPSNTMANMGFCTLTPKETEIALNLIMCSENQHVINNTEEIRFNKNDSMFFDGKLTVDSIGDCSSVINEAQIEAYLLANPKFIPEKIRPAIVDVLCRQIPISPFKPENMDRADICIFRPDRIMDGLVPNVIIELKKNKSNKNVVTQVVRYMRWLEILLENNPEDFQKIMIYVLAPYYVKNIRSYLEGKYEDQIVFMNYQGDEF